jgi:uncharacterized protein
MKKPTGITQLFFVLFIVVSFVLIEITPAFSVSTSIVISQVYGGGGNSGATYTNDFIELFNLGTTSVSLAGWSVQYTSAMGTGNFGASSSVITLLPSITLVPGQYFLIQEAQGAGGTTALPTPDVVGTIAMSATAGKIALVDDTDSLGCNGGSTPCTSTQLAQIIDLVGYGTANFYEGAAPAPALTNATAAFRINGGLTDTDNNSSDFFASSPMPRNTSSPLNTVPEPVSILLVGLGILALTGAKKLKSI